MHEEPPKLFRTGQWTGFEENAVVARIVRRNLARTGGPFLLLKNPKGGG
jgi:hypothetical protein